ncbi:hypothetical protein [Chelativorans sp.]|uniref:hypothetical protein n=1 Tax=Chelativorans sp. TaxID=2203393 RepID=UPI0028127539|nr:hypothetical protein [Chelativorans sp.]
MRKFILFTFTLAIIGLGLGDANAQGHTGYNASDEFGPSSQNDLPAGLKGQSAVSDAGHITSGTGRVAAGYPARAQLGNADRVYRGYDASDDFAVSDD